MYCEKCGSQIDATSNFCDMCGAAVQVRTSFDETPVISSVKSGNTKFLIANISKKRLISAALVFITLLLTLFAWYSSGVNHRNDVEELINDIGGLSRYMDDDEESEAVIGFLEKIASGNVSGIKLATMAPSIVRFANLFGNGTEVSILIWAYTLFFWAAFIIGVINIYRYLTDKRCRTSVWFFVLLALAFLLSLAIMLVDLSSFAEGFKLTFWPFLALILGFAAIFVGREKKKKV